MDKKYIKFDPDKGYPTGNNLVYECLRCGEAVRSQPLKNTHCKCRNIMIDIDYGRLSIQDHNQVKLYLEE